MLARLDAGISQFQPGDLIPGLQRHQVGGQLLRLAFFPDAFIESPGERRANKLVANARPDFVIAFLLCVKVIGEN
ncbi:MAG: hypothetical protein M3Y27_29700, partial [Acidobacteriota bacterium]|nr:hypothetical protein [Acidobacteriota bacterium]